MLAEDVMNHRERLTDGRKVGSSFLVISTKNMLFLQISKFPFLFIEVFQDDVEDKIYLWHISFLCVHHIAFQDLA